MSQAASRLDARRARFILELSKIPIGTDRIPNQPACLCDVLLVEVRLAPTTFLAYRHPLETYGGWGFSLLPAVIPICPLIAESVRNAFGAHRLSFLTLAVSDRER